jgi:hypothetical protein
MKKIFLFLSIGMYATAQAQNVGIGTVTPLKKLHIIGNAEALRIEGISNWIGFAEPAGNYNGFLSQTPTNYVLGTIFGSTKNIQLSPGNSPALTVNPNGNVGIGTNLPSYKFTVYQPSGIGLTQDVGLGGPQIGFYTTTGYAFLQTHNNFDLSFATNNASVQMTLQSGTGNLGIGTSSPSERLTVSTPTSSYGMTHTDGTIKLSSYVGGGGIGGYWGTSSNHPLYFYTNGGSAQVTLLQNGNFGIGTTNPTYKLSVNGNIRSKEVVVESGWADYVFDEQYHLRPLSEVEQYIQANKHLPNIPAAEDIQKNGLSVGEVQTKMMEKIEELTLYVIELKKEIELLKAKK